MLKIGILAFGEAGSQIAEYAINRGFQVVVANTAKIDLEKLKNVPNDCKIHLEGWEGAGRNRNEGREAAISSIDILSEKAKQKLTDCDIVFVAASCAGGTGSGSIPIGIEVISEFKDYVGIITILPDMIESVKAQMNTLECFSELSQFEQLSSIFIIDNEKVRKLHEGKDKKQRYEDSNRNLIENLIEIGSLTRQTSYISNFDKNDLLEVLNERGCTMISRVTIPADSINTEEDVTNAIRHSWSNSYYPSGQTGQIVKAAILGKLPQKATSLINISSIFEEFGLPYDVMEAYYPNNENSNHYTFYTILSGLSYPTERLAQMQHLVNEAEQKISQQIESARTQVFETTSTTSRFERKKAPINRESLKDRLAKFNK